MDYAVGAEIARALLWFAIGFAARAALTHPFAYWRPGGGED